MTARFVRPLGESAAEPSLRAPRAGAHAHSWLHALVGGALAISGCSAILDTEQKQCSVDKDCSNLFGADTPYSCQNNFCVRPACGGNGISQTMADAQCRALGDYQTAICGPDLRCQAPDCLTSADCGEGICNTATNRCIDRECSINKDCGTSPSVTCEDGVCVDPIWGCIGEPDDRPAATLEKATLKLHFVDALTDGPIPNTVVRVCTLPAFDALCAKPAPGQGTYDNATGAVTITGMTPGVPYRIMLDPPASTGFLPVDFYTQRSVRDVMEAQKSVGTVSQAVLDEMVKNLGTVTIPFRLDHDLGGGFSTVFNCKGETAEGVEVYFDKARYATGLAVDAPSTQLYFEGPLPNVERMVTDTSGRFSLVNMKGTEQIPILMRINGQNITSFSTRFFAGRIVVTHFYPRSY